MIRLNDLDKNLPFSVPEGYFDNFATQMQQQIAGSSPRRISLYRELRPYLLVAAVFAGVLFTALPMYRQYQQRLSAQYNTELISYVMDEVNEDMLIDYYLDEE
ncbi:MAG: hypothetical protein LBR81_08515 [Prevotellaceae bacterium]|jgi:hypothetical protein|nr:hypothetical protein [Prevotellaceae bacterium]